MSINSVGRELYSDKAFVFDDLHKEENALTLLVQRNAAMIEKLNETVKRKKEENGSPKKKARRLGGAEDEIASDLFVVSNSNVQENMVPLPALQSVKNELSFEDEVFLESMKDLEYAELSEGEKSLLDDLWSMKSTNDNQKWDSLKESPKKVKSWIKIFKYYQNQRASKRKSALDKLMAQSKVHTISNAILLWCAHDQIPADKSFSSEIKIFEEFYKAGIYAQNAQVRAIAYQFLADAYWKGFGTLLNREIAREYYQKLEIMGEVLHLCSRADQYLLGVGVSLNSVAALGLYEKAKEKNALRAYQALGYYYWNHKNYKLAASLLFLPAICGMKLPMVRFVECLRIMGYPILAGKLDRVRSN